MCEELRDLEEENLLGLKIAFYKHNDGFKNPTKYYFLGVVLKIDCHPDNCDVVNIIEVISLDSKERRYFGQIPGGLWKELLEDPLKQEAHNLVINEGCPNLECDILS